MAETIIEIKNLHKYFGKNEVLKGIDLDIKKGEVVAVLEAMKMENDIVALEDGTIASINVNVGDSVETNQTLVTIN